MLFTLKDGTEITVAEESTKTNINIIEKDYSNLQTYADEFTTENLDGATLGDEVLTNMVAIDITTKKEVTGNVVITLHSREKTEMELLQEQIAAQEDAINFLLMGGETEETITEEE